MLANFMIVDCGGGTVDITTYKLLENNRLSENIERVGNYCGSTFVDRQFINFLGRVLGFRAMDLLRNNHYEQLQYIIQEFCDKAKHPFTGDDPDFMYELNIIEDCPELLQYVSGEEKEKMEEREWIIDINYNTIKKMFDPFIERILSMIRMQLVNSKNCSVIFLAGGFSQSKYLQERIKQKFQSIKVLVPKTPLAAISRGAAMYGSSLSVISSRVLKYTYGIQVRNYWVCFYSFI